MLSAKELKDYVLSLSVPAVGICRGEQDDTLLHWLKKRREAFPICDFEEQDIQKRTEPQLLMPEVKSILVCLFPYYIQQVEGNNISRYAMVQDYHQVARKVLESVASFVTGKVPEAKALPVCDTSPLVDRRLAYSAGLGFYGKNNMLIHPVYGSYFFIGSLLLSVPLEADEPLSQNCGGCNACIEACPGGALSENFGFDCKRCVSYLTQKKTVTSEEQKILARQKSVYGCDVCQVVCPHNSNVPDTPIKAFYEGIISDFTKEDIEQLSNRGFKNVYRQYPFSWCSRQTILKNFEALQKEKL